MKFVLVLGVIIVATISLWVVNSNIHNIKTDGEEGFFSGRNLKFNEEMVYLSNLKEGGAMDVKITKFGRLLVPEKDSNFLANRNYIGKKRVVEKIRPNMNFTIVESIIISPTGFYKIFNVDQREFVVIDEDGKYSVIYEAFVKNNDWKI